MCVCVSVCECECECVCVCVCVSLSPGACVHLECADCCRVCAAKCLHILSYIITRVAPHCVNTLMIQHAAHKPRFQDGLNLSPGIGEHTLHS